MSIYEVILLAIALSIDAGVVSFSHGLCITQNRLKNSLLLAIFTGTFQGLMPVIGYFSAKAVESFISPISKWITFTIFACLGIKFIKEAFEREKEAQLCISLQCLFMIAFATSIDALAAGVSLAMLNTNILVPALLIAIITFINAFLGFWSGCSLKKFPTMFLEIFAGLLLILLAFKCLI